MAVSLLDVARHIADELCFSVETRDFCPTPVDFIPWLMKATYFRMIEICLNKIALWRMESINIK